VSLPQGLPHPNSPDARFMDLSILLEDAEMAHQTITKEQLKTIFPGAETDYLQQVADDLNADLATYGLDTVLRKSHFFAQVRQEAGPRLEANVESLNYSPAGLKSTFKYYRDHADDAVVDGYERDPKTQKITRPAAMQTIANNVYAGRNGNGNAANFRGRGFIQVTGRSNYAATTQQYGKLYPGGGVDFESNPDLMVRFPYGVRSAVCYWVKNNLQILADRGDTAEDVDRITTVINSKTESYQDRRDNFTLACNAFK
jgi:putative chitinase